MNASPIKHYLEKQGSIFQTTCDTEVIAHLIARSPYEQIEDAAREALSMVKGAYALLILTADKLLAAVDPNGLRPMVIGQADGQWVFASETCAFDIVGAEYVRDVEPGELLVVDSDGLHQEHFAQNTCRAMCSFEYIYFARPDSSIHGQSVHLCRKELGRQLAKEAPADADVVTGVPDSSLSAAAGYAEAIGLPYELGLVKNRYIGRTFIQPTQEMRGRSVRMKLNPIRQVVAGQRVIMVDDSIVRGTTSSRIVRLLRDAGAREVHVRISSPPVSNPCFYGIDIATRDQLIVAHKSVDEIREFIGADSLCFLSVDGMTTAIQGETDVMDCGLCRACFTGQYPTDIYPETVQGGLMK